MNLSSDLAPQIYKAEDSSSREMKAVMKKFSWRKSSSREVLKKDSTRVKGLSLRVSTDSDNLNLIRTSQEQINSVRSQRSRRWRS